MDISLKERMLTYEDVSDIQLTAKLPLVISLNGRNFAKTSSLFEKPYSLQFMEIMGNTLIKLASEIDGVSFVYSFNDEIIIITRNDQSNNTETWYGNKIQKIVSASASLASVSFLSASKKLNANLVGDPVFLAKVFALPNSTEVINYLIYKQHQASQIAISMSCFYELLKKYDLETTLSIINNKTIDEKYEILFKECRVNLQTYPLGFWRGIACYRGPKKIETPTGTEIRHKLLIDTNLPFFTKEPDFLIDILKK